MKIKHFIRSLKMLIIVYLVKPLKGDDEELSWSMIIANCFIMNKGGKSYETGRGCLSALKRR
jgi:hypothetical protein